MTHKYPDLRFIEAWLDDTNTAASALSTIATGSPNYISMMKAGKAIRTKHIKAMLEYIKVHPEGIKRIKRLHGSGRRPKKVYDRPEGAGGPPSTEIPVPGPSALEPSLFQSIKNEAFDRGMHVTRLMEEIVRIGWAQYTQRKAA
jgi:hypothetical protein